MEVAVSLHGLTKHYGSSRGIEDITFDVHHGEVLGFLGPNGSGKTTALRTLVGLIHATSGAARMLGRDALKPSPELRESVGYLPSSLGLYSSMTGMDFLRFLANVRRRDCDEEINRLAHRLKVDLERRIQDLSKGNRQKLGVVQAFMGEPEVLILDEPTSGLDPLVQQEFHSLLHEVTSAGHTVFLSSHVLSEVQHVADRVAILREGRLVVVEDVDALRAKALRRIEISFDGPAPAADFATLPGVRSYEVTGDRIALEVQGELDEVVKAASRHHVVDIDSREANLDDVFLAYYSNGRVS